MANPNIIGDNGERYTAIRLTQGQLFDVVELGGKTGMDFEKEGLPKGN